jgi:hypothetical protein
MRVQRKAKAKLIGEKPTTEDKAESQQQRLWDFILDHADKFFVDHIPVQTIQDMPSACNTVSISRTLSSF